VNKLESWLRDLYSQHDEDLPDEMPNLLGWKKALAAGAVGFRAQNRVPRYDTIFIDEAQDLLDDEIELIAQWSPVLFLA
jgi:hypothetical protein